MLTPRLTMILQLLADGRHPKDICNDLDLALDTVRSHMLRIRGRLNAQSTMHAIAIGIRQNLIR